MNMSNLDLAIKWAKEERHVWGLYDICGSVASVAFSLTTPNIPRKLDVVMKKFMEKMMQRSDAVVCGGCYIFESTAKDLTDVIHSELMSIKEFREWNLTSLEYEQGVDPDNDKYNEWWAKSDKDFIDLDAFKQNIYCELRCKLIEIHFFE